MNIYKDFKNSEIIEKLVGKIRAYTGKSMRIMEVCGSHTDAIGKYGIRDILPENIKLVSGPGCPVCVTDTLYMDKAIELSKREDIIITSFGDLIKVRGTEENIKLKENVKVVLSPIEALEIAKANPTKETVFLSVGFETTTPLTAHAIKCANEMNIKNLSFFVSNKTMPNILKYLMNLLNKEQQYKVDGFIFPGHVAAVVGYDFYERFTSEYNVKGIIAGFEPIDILGAIVSILYGKENFRNLYSRFVTQKGNEITISLVNEVFEECDTYLREIGEVKGAGQKIKENYSSFDANIKFDLKYIPKDLKKTQNCICGEILLGKKSSFECPLFGRACTPDHAVGPCMVSNEGSCATVYKYLDIYG